MLGRLSGDSCTLGGIDMSNSGRRHLKGNIDLHGQLGLDDSVPAGYEQINIQMRVKADCADAELKDLLTYAQQHSPVCNTVCRPVPVVIERVKA